MPLPIHLGPWLDTWSDMELPANDMMQLAKKKKQECKNRWVTFRKWGRSIMKLDEYDVQEICRSIEKEAEGWQEEIEYQQYLYDMAKAKREEKAEAEVRFKEEGWPEPVGLIGVQTKLFG